MTIKNEIGIMMTLILLLIMAGFFIDFVIKPVGVWLVILAMMIDVPLAFLLLSVLLYGAVIIISRGDN